MFIGERKGTEKDLKKLSKTQLIELAYNLNVIKNKANAKNVDITSDTLIYMILASNKYIVIEKPLK